MKKEVKWKFSGECDVSVQRHTECWECKETKLCWAIPTKIAFTTQAIVSENAYFCDECKKDTDTATVSVEKADE